MAGQRHGGRLSVTDVVFVIKVRTVEHRPCVSEVIAKIRPCNIRKKMKIRGEAATWRWRMTRWTGAQLINCDDIQKAAVQHDTFASTASSR
jgi:hypothetical protein